MRTIGRNRETHLLGVITARRPTQAQSALFKSCKYHYAQGDLSLGGHYSPSANQVQSALFKISQQIDSTIVIKAAGVEERSPPHWKRFQRLLSSAHGQWASCRPALRPAPGSITAQSFSEAGSFRHCWTRETVHAPKGCSAEWESSTQNWCTAPPHY